MVRYPRYGRRRCRSIVKRIVCCADYQLW